VTKSQFAADLLAEASDLVGHTRQAEYGTPADNMHLIAEFWNLYLGGREILARDVPMLMLLLKVARASTGQIRRDNYVDAAGYAALAGQLALVNTTNSQGAS
jgi:hypothetical protein